MTDLFNYQSEIEEEQLTPKQRAFYDLDARIQRAEQGNKEDLDELMNDDDYRVRELVAHHGYAIHLNRLVYDDDATVRGEVAAHGRKKDLDILKNDRDPKIKKYAKKLLGAM